MKKGEVTCNMYDTSCEKQAAEFWFFDYPLKLHNRSSLINVITSETIENESFIPDQEGIQNRHC